LVREHTIVSEPRTRARAAKAGQLEGRLDWRQLASLTLHWSRAENAASRRFREFFGEIAGHRGSMSLSLFVDVAEDRSALPAVFDRETFGTQAVLPIRGAHSLQLESARLRGVRDLAPATSRSNRYAALAWTWAEQVSLPVRPYIDRRSGDRRRQADAVTALCSTVHVVGSASALGSHHDVVGFWN
jgi:hypothetical protein